MRCLFVFGRFRQAKYIRSETKIKSMTVNILQNWSQIYSSHNSNIKCIDSTIKYIGSELFYYAINLDVVSSIVVFNDFDYMFLPMYYYFESIKLFFS